MRSSWGGDRVEYAPFSNSAGHELVNFVHRNLPPEAKQAIDDKIVTPTVNELMRLAGIQIDDQPDLTIDELIGPTTIGEVPNSVQGVYFSGPKHPLLIKARRSTTFLTYQHLLDIRSDLGIKQEAVTTNFKGLLRSVFSDEAISTHGGPRDHNFEGSDSNNWHMLHRFAIRRKLAQMAMRGDYIVGTSGTQGTDIFNGFGRTLIREIYNPSNRVRWLNLTMELEKIPDVTVADDDDRAVRWDKTYEDEDGIGHKMSPFGNDEYIAVYLYALLEEIGAVKSRRQSSGCRVSDQAFVVAVGALCPLDAQHTKSIKAGHSCNSGVHYRGLTPSSVHKAKKIAEILSKADTGEINLEDPALNERTNGRAANPAHKPEW